MTDVLFPGRSQRGESSYAGVYGARIDADTPPRQGVTDGLEARGERLAAARSAWDEARPEEFELVDRRLYRRLEDGRLFRHVPGAAWASVGTPAAAEVTTFFVDSANRFVFLCDAGVPEGSTVRHGGVYGRRVEPAAMRQDLPRVY